GGGGGGEGRARGRAARGCKQDGAQLSRAKGGLGRGPRHSPRSLLCGRWMLCVWSVRPSSAYAPFKSQPVRVPISTRNDCDLCAIAPIERCTAADPLGRSRGAATGNDRHNGAVAERRPKTPSPG